MQGELSPWEKPSAERSAAQEEARLREFQQRGDFGRGFVRRGYEGRSNCEKRSVKREQGRVYSFELLPA